MLRRASCCTCVRSLHSAVPVGVLGSSVRRCCVSYGRGPSDRVVQLMHDEGVKSLHEITIDFVDVYGDKFCYDDLTDLQDRECRARLSKLYNLDKSMDTCSELLHLAWYPREADAHDAIRQLLECGTNVVTPGKYGMTPLHVACRNGARRIISLLIDHGADPTALTTFGETPLDVAVKHGHRTVSKLLSRGAASKLGKRRPQSRRYADASLSREAAAILPERFYRPPERAVEMVHDEGRRVHDRALASLVKEYAGSVNHENLLRRLRRNDAHAELRKLYNLGAGGLEAGVAPMPGFSSMEQQQQHYITGLLALTVDDDRNCARDAVAQLMECGADIATPGKHGMTPLHVACRNGALCVVRLLLDHGADAAVLTEVGESTLFVAAQNGHGDIVKVLAQRGTPVHGVNNLGMSPLHAAAGNGHAAVVGFLLRRQPTSNINLRTHSGWTPLHCAATHRSVVRLLIKRGGDINAVTNDGMTPLHVAAKYGCSDSDVHQLLVGNNINASTPEGATPLLTAVMHGRSSTVAALAKLGVSVELPNTLGVTPLHAAALKGNDDCIRVLAENGANLNATNKLGETALHTAAKCSWCDPVDCDDDDVYDGFKRYYHSTAEVLVQLGADISAVTTNGETPLFVAAAHGREKCIVILAGNSTDKKVVDVPARGGVTPLLIAVQNNHLEAVKKLLECRADVNARADDGRTPLSVASLRAPEGDKLVRELNWAIAMRRAS